MSLPNEVRKQVKQAEKTRSEYYDKPKAEEAEAPAEEVVQEEAKGDTPAPAAEPPKSEEAPAEEPVKAEEEEQEQESKENDPEYWKHKYDVLNGKYKKEVPALHEQNKNVQQQLQNVETLLANLQVPDEPVTGTSKAFLSKEEIDDYGSDMINVMKKAAREAVSEELSRLENENTRLKQMLGNVSTTAAESARDVMLRTLDTEVKGWQDQNTNADFIAWLEKPDVYSGISRQQLLTEAFDRNHTARVVAIFKGYRSENAIEQGAPETPAPEASQEGQTQQPQVNMDTLVAPGSSKGAGSSSAQSDKRSFTQQEIAAFYADVRSGKYKTRQKEREKLEGQIFSAVNEGRITY